MLVVKRNLLEAAITCPEQSLNFGRYYGSYVDAEQKVSSTRTLYKKGDADMETLEFAKRNAMQKCSMAINKLLAWNTSFHQKEGRNFMQPPENREEAKKIMNMISQMICSA